MSFISELWLFMRVRKKFWLLPILVVLAMFGALIVGVFSLGLRLMGADAQWAYLLIGLLIIGAVALDQWIRRISV